MPDKITYHSYLKLDQLLSAQDPQSDKVGRKAHDEMLFIITHQTYELWFKLLINEVDSVITLFSKKSVDDKDMGIIVSRLNRVIEIQKVMIDQINILETMTPLDFLDFRDLFYTASGFQSIQFRLFENKLGLKPEIRLSYNKMPYSSHFSKEQEAALKESEKGVSIFDGVNNWLERTPFLKLDGYDFWSEYSKAVMEMFNKEKSIVQGALISEDDKARNLKLLNDSIATFQSLLSEHEFKKLQEAGTWRLSYKASHAALFIQLYREQPALQLPFRLITSILDIDELMSQWRYKHALMVKRMLGTKVGSGGSSGYEYLKNSIEQHKIFSDFFQLTTFFIPRSALPKLPEQVEKKLAFKYSS